jgi:hypothetical protein
MQRGQRGVKNDFIICGKHRIINSTFHSHREGYVASKIRNPEILGIETAKQGSHDNMLECHGRKDHEGKTSGSVLHGLVFAHECALLVNFHINDTKKIPMDALGTLRNTGIHAFVSPKCGTKLGYARYQIRFQGLEFEVGNKYLPRQLTGFLIHQKHQAC